MRKALRFLGRAYSWGMNLNYADWKLYLVGVLFLAVVFALTPYFAEVERKKAQDKLKK